MDIDQLRSTKTKIKISKGKNTARYINISNGEKELFIYNSINNIICSIKINENKLITKENEYELSNDKIRIVNINDDYGYILVVYKKKNIVYIVASDVFEIYE